MDGPKTNRKKQSRKTEFEKMNIKRDRAEMLHRDGDRGRDNERKKKKGKQNILRASHLTKNAAYC